MKEKASVSRKEQAILTKKKIFDTTMLLIRKKSYSKITIREICQNAEISVGTFYLYFLSKDDILLDLYYKMEEDFFPQAPKQSDCRQALLSLAGQFLSHLHDSFERDLLQEIYRINLSSETDAFRSPDRPFMKRLVSLLEELRADGKLLPETDCPLLADRLFIFLQGYLFHWLCDDSLDFAPMKDTCLSELEKYFSAYLVS